MRRWALFALACASCLPSTAEVGAPAAEAGGALRIYSNQLFPPVSTRVTYGYDRDEICTVSLASCSAGGDAACGGGLNDFCGISLNSLVPGSPNDIWELACDPLTPGQFDCQAASWDFSGNNPTAFPGMFTSASTNVTISSAETCSYNKCGFSPAAPNKVLSREDRGLGASNVPTVSAVELEDRAPDDHTIWLRGVVRREGVPASAGLGKGESRLCYVGSGIPEVPLWQFPHCDGQGCYMQVGDIWEPENAGTGAPEAFNCDNTVFNQECAAGGGCGFACAIYSFADGTFAGKQSGRVFNEGLVTLPSGHRFRALVAYTNAEFNTSAFSNCPGFASQGVRTLVYLWVVPKIGTVARLQSTTLANGVQSFSPGEDILSEMDIKFGLFPPLSVTVGAVTGTSVNLSWDPGLITDRIDRYRIYWDTDSGASTSYAFDSDTNPAQVGFSGTSATISGLTPGTTYYFTVNAVSDFTDPSSSVTTTYESLLFPDQAPAVPVDLPVEVSATTTGGLVAAGAVPDGNTRPGTQLMLDKGAGTLLDLTWGASCVGADTDYAVYEGSIGTFAVKLPATCSTSGATSTSVNPLPGDRFLLVVPSNAQREGSYGLDGFGAERGASGSPCRPQLLGAPVCP